MAPKPRVWIVFIGPTEQQDGFRVNRHVQRHVTDVFAGGPFCTGVSGCWDLGGGWDLICRSWCCGVSGPAYWKYLALVAGCFGRASLMWLMSLCPAIIWWAKKGLMNTLKSKPWCNTCLGHYEYLLNKRGTGRVSQWKSLTAALRHQGWCSEFSLQVRRIISAILNLGPEGEV